MHFDNFNLHCVISIHALLAESDSRTEVEGPSFCISIHALLAESDKARRASRQQPAGISIHALLAESDHFLFYSQQRHLPFLSTLSLRRATPSYKHRIHHKEFLSTLSLRRATDTSSLMRCQAKFLSTLSLRRATSPASVTPAASRNFYPRSPCGERPQSSASSLPSTSISIHALLAESDAMQIVIVIVHTLFLSTLSLRRATVSLRCPCYVPHHFYPRSPCGERRQADFY